MHRHRKDTVVRIAAARRNLTALPKGHEDTTLQSRAREERSRAVTVALTLDERTKVKQSLSAGGVLYPSQKSPTCPAVNRASASHLAP